jgi:catechol 2,3-dioxygenase
MAEAANDTEIPEVALLPVGMNHLVLNVYDIEETHQFWTEIVGLKLVAKLKSGAGPDGRQRPKMQFYSGYDEVLKRHHDIAFVENPNLPPRPTEGWDIYSTPNAINHIAFALPDRDSWLAQLRFMQSRGVKFHRRIDHGMSHSVYIADPNGYGVEILYETPRENWEQNLGAAFNYAKEQPSDGPEAILDLGDAPVFLEGDE